MVPTSVHPLPTPYFVFCTPYSDLSSKATPTELVGPERSAGRPKAVLGVTVGSVNYADQSPTRTPKAPTWINTVLPAVTVRWKNAARKIQGAPPGYFFSSSSFPPCVHTSPLSLPSIIPLSFSQKVVMASLRIGTSALRSSVAKPVQTAALNGARCYSSKAKVIWSSFQLASQLTY